MLLKEIKVKQNIILQMADKAVILEKKLLRKWRSQEKDKLLDLKVNIILKKLK